MNILCDQICERRMKMDISLLIKRLEGYEWDKIDNDCKTKIIEGFLHGGLQGQYPCQYLFTPDKFWRIDQNIIYGIFAQQCLEKFHKYDQTGLRIAEHVEPFEDILFIIEFSKQWILLQNKKFPSEKKISMEEILINFGKALNTIFASADQYMIDIRETFKETDSSEFKKILKTHWVTYLKVSSLLGKTIPEDFRIFNPDYDKDKLFHQEFDKEWENIDKIILDAGGGNNRGNLQKSKIANIAANTGTPELIEYVEDGKVTQMKSGKEKAKIKWTIKGEIPTKEEVVNISIKISSGKFEHEKPEDGPHQIPLF